MKINLKQLATGPGVQERSIDFACDLDLSFISLWGRRPFTEPVHVVGTARNYLGILTVSFTAETVRTDECARCLEAVARKERYAFTHTVMEGEGGETAEDDDSFVYAPQGVLDLDGLVTSDLLLEQEPVVLCAPDCQGLCPDCGTNRNHGTCTCGAGAEEEDAGDSAPQTVRPFAALLELMDETTDQE